MKKERVQDPMRLHKQQYTENRSMTIVQEHTKQVKQIHGSVRMFYKLGNILQRKPVQKFDSLHLCKKLGKGVVN